MSYSTKGDRVISHLDGFTVHFNNSQDKVGRTDRARAVEDLTAHDNAIRAAARARAGRAVSDSEIRSGKLDRPDTRSIAERVRQDAVHHVQSANDPNVNTMANEVSRLEDRLSKAWRPDEKARIEKRLSIARIAAGKRQEEIDLRLAHEAAMATPAMQHALAQSKFWLANLRLDPRAESQSALEVAIAAERDLLATGDVDAWQEKTNRWQEQRQAAFAKVTADKRAEIAALEADLEATSDLTPAEIPTE